MRKCYYTGMMKVKTLSAAARVAFLATACLFVLPAAAWVGGVRLNDYAVTNNTGKIVVLGTAGSWENNANATKEAAFDGDVNTFFDPNGNDIAWAGYELAEPALVTRLRYTGRTGWTGRMTGALFQGSNDPNFPDGETVTFHVANPPAGWNPLEWVDVTLDGAYGPFKYLRIIYNNAGNVSELEFYGLPRSGDSAPVAPGVASWYLNGRAGFSFAVDPEIPQIYYLERRADGADDFERFRMVEPALGGMSYTWIDDEKPSSGGEFRVRGVNAKGEGWTAFSIPPPYSAMRGRGLPFRGCSVVPLIEKLPTSLMS